MTAVLSGLFLLACMLEAFFEFGDALLGEGRSL